MAQYTAEELITKRAEVSAMILDALMGKIADDGFTVTEFNITDIDFSDAFDAAIEAKAVKQQEVVTAQAELEKQKIENEKEIAEAEKDAKVMELQNQQITENTLKLKELEVKEKLIEKWSGNFPSTMLSDDVNALFNIGQ
jgi:regulator of protease activity HflC (stomatin/prohibitin superfamily)